MLYVGDNRYNLCMNDMINYIKLWIDIGRPRRSWVDNIKMDLREIGWDWSG
jgi:hypothetical protein